MNQSLPSLYTQNPFLATESPLSSSSSSSSSPSLSFSSPPSTFPKTSDITLLPSSPTVSTDVHSLSTGLSTNNSTATTIITTLTALLINGSEVVFVEGGEVGGNGSTWTVGGVGEEWGPVDWVVVILKGSLMGAVIIASVLGNLLVIVSVIRYHKLRVITNYFVVSMALADMLVALMAMVFNASVQVTNTWLFGAVMCDLWNSMDVYFSTVSILHLCCISIDRYTAIVQPLDYPLRMTRRTVTLMLSVVWCAPFFISVLPIFLGWYTTQEQLELMASTPGLCDFKVNLVYALVSSSVSFWIPGLIMLVMYFRIYREADRQEMMVFRSTVAALLLNKHLHINGMARNSIHVTDTTQSAPLDDNTPATLGRSPSLNKGVSNGAKVGNGNTTVDLPTSDESSPTPTPTPTPSVAVTTGVVSGVGGVGGGVGEGTAKRSMTRRLMSMSGRKVRNEESGGIGVAMNVPLAMSGDERKKQASLHKMKRERKAAKTLGIIVSAFLLCWLPFFTWYLVAALCGDACAVPDVLVTLLFWIGYFNSTLNPIIYAYFNRDFRKAFRKTLRHYGLSCRCRLCRRSSSARRNSCCSLCCRPLCYKRRTWGAGRCGRGGDEGGDGGGGDGGGGCGGGGSCCSCARGTATPPDPTSSEIHPSSDLCNIEMTVVDKEDRMGRRVAPKRGEFLQDESEMYSKR